MKCGIYYRVLRDDKWKSLDLTEMTRDEIEKILDRAEPYYAARVIATMAEIFRSIEVEE